MTGQPVPLAIADTSLFVALEHDRPLRATPPERVAVSVITIAELRAGVLAATDTATSASRLATLERAQLFEAIPIDLDVAAAWSTLRVELRDLGRCMPVNDSWIAATAIAHNLPVATQDDDYDGAPGLSVVKL